MKNASRNSNLTNWLLGVMATALIVQAGWLFGNLDGRINKVEASLNESNQRVSRLEATYDGMVTRLANIESKVDKLLTR